MALGNCALLLDLHTDSARFRAIFASAASLGPNRTGLD